MGKWASPRVVTPGRSTEPPGLQPPPRNNADLIKVRATTAKPDSGEGVVVLTNRRDGQACRRDEMPTRQREPWCEEVMKQAHRRPLTCRPEPDVSYHLVAHRRSISRADSDGRKDNNNGITAECGCPRKICTSSASWSAAPSTGRISSSAPVTHRARP